MMTYCSASQCLKMAEEANDGPTIVGAVMLYGTMRAIHDPEKLYAKFRNHCDVTLQEITTWCENLIDQGLWVRDNPSDARHMEWIQEGINDITFRISFALASNVALGLICVYVPPVEKTDTEIGSHPEGTWQLPFNMQSKYNRCH